MGPAPVDRTTRLAACVRRYGDSPNNLAFLPATALAAFWVGGEWFLMAVALGWPLTLAICGGKGALSRPAAPESTEADICLDPSAAEAMVDAALTEARDAGHDCVCLLVEIGGIDTLAGRHGVRVVTETRSVCLARMRAQIGPGDRAVRLGDGRYMVILAPGDAGDELALTAAAQRIRDSLERTVRLEGDSVCLTATIGCCSARQLATGSDGAALLDASFATSDAARQAGPSTIRTWSEGLGADRAALRFARSELAQALESGEIRPWFQPQLCTSTGRITGVEALARWSHPDRGTILPAHFLEAVESGGHMARLGQVIRAAAFEALKAWDAAGLSIPRVALNLSAEELRDPDFVTTLKWDLDRYDLTGDRLTIEVLETVLAETRDCAVTRTIAALKSIGCRIDLDDFGTGHATIRALQRMPVDRVKIDRSFIARLDREEPQRRMVCGILSLAEQVAIETVAEGVETRAEHALLAQLGCDHVQGFGIARPMPAPQIADWARSHLGNLADTSQLGRDPP